MFLIYFPGQANTTSGAENYICSFTYHCYSLWLSILGRMLQKLLNVYLMADFLSCTLQRNKMWWSKCNVLLCTVQNPAVSLFSSCLWCKIFLSILKKYRGCRILPFTFWFSRYGSGWGANLCISKRFLEEVAAAGPGATLCKPPLSWNFRVSKRKF